MVLFFFFPQSNTSLRHLYLLLFLLPLLNQAFHSSWVFEGLVTPYEWVVISGVDVPAHQGILLLNGG